MAANTEQSSSCTPAGKQNSASSAKVEDVWTLLERAKCEEEKSKESVFIRECAIHPDLFIVLANDRQLKELSLFCTNQEEFCVFGVDRRLIYLTRNISLTVTTFQNLKLVNTNTNKSLVFIGPLLMHQHKDWQTFSKFSNALISAEPLLEGILACGTDGETALIKGFQHHFPFAEFLCCFTHFKENRKHKTQALFQRILGRSEKVVYR